MSRELKGLKTRRSKSRALDTVQLRECLVRTKTALRWAPGVHQLADVLTKDAAGPADSWKAYCRQEWYRLADEDEALQLRAAEKEARLQRGRERKERAEATSQAKAEVSDPQPEPSQ